MEQPQGFKVLGEEHKVIRLRKAIYGLKQAARAWWHELDKSLKVFNFTHLYADAGIFVAKHTDGTLVIIQLWTNKVINFDNLRTRIFIKILTSDSESETLKLFRKGVSLIFPHFFGVAKFLGIFNTPKSLVNQPSLDQFCTIYDLDVVDV